MDSLKIKANSLNFWKIHQNCSRGKYDDVTSYRNQTHKEQTNILLYTHRYIPMSEIDWRRKPSFYYTDSMPPICNDEKVRVTYHDQRKTKQNILCLFTCIIYHIITKIQPEKGKILLLSRFLPFITDIILFYLFFETNNYTIMKKINSLKTKKTH
jgi:hypothetical protein